MLVGIYTVLIPRYSVSAVEPITSISGYKPILIYYGRRVEASVEIVFGIVESLSHVPFLRN